MDARTKALKAHRKRLQTRRMKRVEVTLRENDAALVRKLAATLRRDGVAARRVRAVLSKAVADKHEPTLAEILAGLPDISGPEFDSVFEEIEQFRHHPVMMKVRDVEL